MKANGLMLDDWVYVVGTFISVGENGAATSISISDVETRAAKINCLTNKATYTDAPTSGEYLFNPIPLTSEILEKNAYPDKGSWYYFGDFYVAHYGDCYVIHQNPDDDKREFLCRIYYVHELQHALRLCGLTDLADNFKI